MFYLYSKKLNIHAPDLTSLSMIKWDGASKYGGFETQVTRIIQEKELKQKSKSATAQNSWSSYIVQESQIFASTTIM